MNDTVPSAVSMRSENDTIELHEVVVRDPATGGTKYMTVHEDTGLVLKETDFPYTTRCAFVFRFKEEATDEFWHQGSVAQDCQGLQLIVNEAINILCDGLRMSSFGAAFADPGTSAASKMVKFAPGSINRDIGLKDAQMFSPNVNVSPCYSVIQLCMSHAQLVVRLSSLGAGGPLKEGSNVTAREVDAAQAGQNTGVEDYVDNFADDLPLLFEHCQELVALYDDKANSDPDVARALRGKYDWNVQVVSPSETPGSQMQALLTLFQMAADPATGYKKREIATRYLRLLERKGVTDASGLQMPESPDDIVMEAALALGIDPQILLALVAQAKVTSDEEAQYQQQLQDMPASEGGGGVPPGGGGVLSQLGAGPQGQVPGANPAVAFG